MDGLTKIVQRIYSIEQRFAKSAVQPQQSTFSNLLTKVQEDQSSPILNSSQQSVAAMIELSARRNGVDPKLALAVAKTESNLRPDAVSSAGAIGVMQLMPETASGLGVRNSYDPRDNVDGGVRYLKQLLNTFNGDTVKAVAAYNAGPQAVKDYGGVPPYAETQSYVAKVMSLYR